MTNIEAGKCLAELIARYERMAGKLLHPVPSEYYEAVSLAIMALGADEKRKVMIQ